MDLDRENIMRLIEEYGKRNVLWDQKHPFHFHKVKKSDAWQEIADVFELPVDDIKKKVNSLLGSLRREKLKGKKMKGTRDGAEEVYKSDWFALPSFSFLLDKNEPKNTLSSEGVSEMVNTDIQPDIDYSINVSDTNDDADTSFTIPQSATPARATSKSKKKRMKQKGKDPRIEMAYKFLQAPIEKDDCTQIFAKYVAEKMNTFDPYTKSVLTHRINNLIFEAEMSRLGAAPNGSMFVNASSPSSSYTSASPPSQSKYQIVNSNSHKETNQVYHGMSDDQQISNPATELLKQENTLQVAVKTEPELDYDDSNVKLLNE